MKSKRGYWLKGADINDFSQTEYENEYALLDRKTCEALRNKPPLKAKQTIAARIVLRQMLSDIYGVTEYKIEYNKNGKPLLPFCNFSISHTDSKVFCAVSNNPIGLDVECERTIKKAEHYPLFTDNETMFVNREEEISNTFLEVWTRKEAYIKLMGLKLTDAKDVDTTSITEKQFETYKENGVILTLCY